MASSMNEKVSFLISYSKTEKNIIGYVRYLVLSRMDPFKQKSTYEVPWRKCAKEVL